MTVNICAPHTSLWASTYSTQRRKRGTALLFQQN